jgi:hypothetical protein
VSMTVDLAMSTLVFWWGGVDDGRHSDADVGG